MILYQKLHNTLAEKETLGTMCIMHAQATAHGVSINIIHCLCIIIAVIS